MKLQVVLWTSLTLLTHCFRIEVSCWVITVQFDGSLRPPYDFGVPTTTLGRLAACACTISYSKNVHITPHVMICGKRLNATSSTTSGEVEYEGLLLALNALRTYVRTQDKENGTRNKIVVEGDCKTVIDQMSGTATPRRLIQYNERARKIVNEINDEIHADEGQWSRIQFQHIPRINNTVCDRLSAAIIIEQEREAFNGLCDDVINFHQFVNITTILDRWLQPKTSIIPISRRPPLYRYMAEIAVIMNDYSGLLELTRMYDSDLRLLESSLAKTIKHAKMESPLTIKNEASKLDILRMELIINQIISLHELGRSKEAERVQNKSRYLLSRFKKEVLEIRERVTSGTSALPSNTSWITLQTEMSAVNYGRDNQVDDWPEAVQFWLAETTRSAHWNENHHSEWISIK